MTHMSNITGVFVKQMCTQNLIPMSLFTLSPRFRNWVYEVTQETNEK